MKWVEGFNVGSVIEGKIGEAKDIGVVVSFDEYNDVLGFVTHHQCMYFLVKFVIFMICYDLAGNDIHCIVMFSVGGLTLETGSIVQAAVLDVAKAERLVDLSLKPEFVDKSQEESSKGQIQKKVKPYFLLSNSMRP